MPTDVQASELNQLFRENFRRRRVELGLSQAALAERLNSIRGRDAEKKVHAPYISDVEHGRRVPYVGSLAEFAEALETSPEQLLSSVEEISA